MNQLITLFNPQEYAAVISLIGAFLVISVVLYIVGTSTIKEDKKEVKKKVYRARGRYFFGLVACIVILLFVSMRLLPYPKFQTNSDEVVSVVAMQWLWKMAPGVTNDSPVDFKGTNEITLPVNKTIKFIVRSGDVNHNFGIYSSTGVLLAQIQAMPEYSNELQYNFKDKGDYDILCLEFCGVAHQAMFGKIHVE